MTTQHTPLPYELIWEDGKHGIIGAATEKKLIAIVGNNPDDGLNDQRKANAEFMVRACNAHYEMLAALEAFVEKHKWGLRHSEEYLMAATAITKAKGTNP